MKLYKSILDRANNSTKEENERFMKLLKKNADRKKIKTITKNQIKCKQLNKY